MFKDVKGYESIYKINEDGVIKSTPRNGNGYKEKIIKHSLDSYGYEIVHLRNGNKNSTKKVHRLLAEAFIPNPDNKPTVDHIDGNKTNNRLSNLRWATQSEQQLNAIRNGNRQDCSNRVKVAQLDKDGNMLNVYDSLKEVERQTGIKWQGVSHCINGTRKSAGGYTWIKFND